MPASSCYLEIQNINQIRWRDRDSEFLPVVDTRQVVSHPDSHPGMQAEDRPDQTTISVLMFEAERGPASLLNPPGEDRDKLSDVAGERADHGDAVMQHHVGITRQHGVGLGNHWEQ